MRDTQLGAVVRHIRRLAVPPVTQRLSDVQLLERFRQHREEAAFAALMRRHGGLVWGVCRHVLRPGAGRRGRLPGHLPRPGRAGRRDPQARVAGLLAPRDRLPNCHDSTTRRGAATGTRGAAEAARSGAAVRGRLAGAAGGTGRGGAAAAAAAARRLRPLRPGRQEPGRGGGRPRLAVWGRSPARWPAPASTYGYGWPPAASRCRPCWPASLSSARTGRGGTRGPGRRHSPGRRGGRRGRRRLGARRRPGPRCHARSGSAAS